MHFEKDFVFGVATASYQIEGAADEGGRTPSIWDVFSKTPGNVTNGDTGDIACDHYHRYKEDIAIMKELGVDSYRLSISWPRIFPAYGVINPEGVRFYRSILQELKDKGIKANVTLFHWDLPLWAHELGGWTNRESADWFCDYAKTCFAEFGDLVDMWATHNEPICSSIVSYLVGKHAPGFKSVEKGIKAAHHILLSHGKAVSAYRQTGQKRPIGIVINMSPIFPQSNSFENKLACSNQDGMLNRWFLDPLFKKTYPMDIVNLYAARCSDFDFIQEGDFDIISEPFDYLGVNFYMREIVQYNPMAAFFSESAVTQVKKTEMGWDVTPEAFVDVIRRVREDYTDLPIYITENGSAWNDVVVDGRVKDSDRQDYLQRHLEELSKMNEAGMNVKGYYAWSLLDNFEWSHGYTKRFGLVYVDYQTMERIKKDSYYLYQDIIAKSRG